MMRVTAVATGKVQGVGYRHFVEVCARRFGLHGSVQNMPDGSVRIIAEGSPASLEEFALLVWAHGEPGIRVDGLQALQGEATGEFKGFWVKW
ncbi:acylphosphatase [Methanoregula sp.]|uniref:acylphosphatase n=1 Tax=Methanoregula sp. TaxID=2052170 RepID=UPI003BAF4A9A